MTNRDHITACRNGFMVTATLEDGTEISRYCGDRDDHDITSFNHMMRLAAAELPGAPLCRISERARQLFDAETREINEGNARRHATEPTFRRFIEMAGDPELHTSHGQAGIDIRGEEVWLYLPDRSGLGTAYNFTRDDWNNLLGLVDESRDSREPAE